LIDESIRERYRWVEDLGSHLSPEEQQKVIEGLTLMTVAAHELTPAE
jgi:hypothetical protein